MRVWHLVVGLLAASVVLQQARATEPNETFATATVAPEGVLVFSDTLTPGFPVPPDTFLGAVDDFDFVYDVNDDDSIYGDGRASGLSFLNVNSAGSIDLKVTGAGDEFFFGNHGESGSYVVYVDVYDSFGEYLESFTDERTLTAGEVDEFSYFNVDWAGGSYDVFLDNQLFPPTGGDVDFFRFDKLVPGGAFTAVTADPTDSGIDTILGLFNASGALIDVDDDGVGGDSLLSKLVGTVPASGSLVFAVTGLGDDADFNGAHSENGAYELRLTAAIAGPSANFNSTGGVNGADFTIWKQGFGLTGSPPRSQGNADGDGDVDGADFLIWQRQFGGPGSLAAATPVPEPAAAMLLAWMLAMPRGWRRTMQPKGR